MGKLSECLYLIINIHLHVFFPTLMCLLERAKTSTMHINHSIGRFACNVIQLLIIIVLAMIELVGK